MKITVLLVVLAGLTLPLSAAFEVKQEGDPPCIVVLENGKELTRYHVSRVPYVYPLPSPSGANLARHWPMDDSVKEEERDHPHHRSLWFSHGAVNGFDFWSWTGKGEPRIDHKETVATSGGAEAASFTVKLDWIAAGNTQLHETRTYRFSRPDAQSLSIEMDSTLEATDRDVLFGDTKEGTFALRVDRSLRLKGPQAKGHILDSEGRTDNACWGKRSNWLAFHGPDESGEPAVLAMFDHPSNLRHPTWWHARDYGLLASNPFGIHDFEGKKDNKTLGDYTLAKGKSLRFRYLVVLHHGSITSAHLPQLWEQFSAAAK